MRGFEPQANLAEEEEVELYKSLDELLGDNPVADEGESDACSEAKSESLRNDDPEADA